MRRFVQGDSRTQSFRLPEALYDVTDTNHARIIDVFVDELNLRQPGAKGVEPAFTGRPSGPHRGDARDQYLWLK
jgi:hypothetical protein